jgi:TonB family protein
MTASRPQHLRVAAVWGTTVIAIKTLGRGESFVLGDDGQAVLPIPDGIDMAPVPVRGAPGGWEIDARGVHSGLLRLRGRDEDPLAVARSGAPIPVVPGDFGVLQYGLFTIFFQYTTPPNYLPAAWGPELLIVLALFSSVIFHAGGFGLLRALLTPPPIEKPLELTSPEEYAARFGLHRAVVEETPPPEPSPADSAGGSGVKDPGAEDKKPQGGGRKIAGAEGKFGNKGPNDHAEIPGEIKPTTNYGGLSEVLSSDTGEEIKHTLKTINTVSEALSGIKSQNLVMGGGPGTGLRSAGAGGGGHGAGVAFGSGTLDTGWGAGNGGGFGSGTGGPGGRGTGGHGRGGSGGGTGTGIGGGAGGGGASEAKVGVSAGTPASRGGLSPDQVKRVVMAHTGALRACYESEAQRNPNLQGGVTVTWKIEPSGSVASASIASSSMNNPRVEGCVLRQVKAWKFPTAETPTDVQAFPFKFGVGG